jgi:hypothetical protein
MKIRKRISLGAVVLILSATVAAPAAAQQSLALSYKLGVNAEDVQPGASTANRCDGFSWVALASCGRDLLARIAPITERVTKALPFVASAAAAPESAAPASSVPAETTARTDELPALLPPPAEARTVRTGNRESVIGSSRTADLLLRFGSSHRFKSNDDSGSEWSRFSDTTYQTHLENKGHKALGLELFVPFQ